MIRFEQVSVTYEGRAEPALQGVDLEIPEGELCLLVGPSGVGKSTLLGTVSGLVPHFTGGTLRGRVTVAGRDTRTHKPRELADVVGSVGQDPLAHFVTDTVEDELAYGMESLGLPPGTMRRRVEETLDLLGLNELRDRPIVTLSGGQQQRVAIGSVLTPHPRVLVLDEPTSALDPSAAEEVLAVVQRLVHDLGTTVLMAEHRLERVVQYADQVLLLPGPGAPAGLGDPATLLAASPVQPPVVELAALAGWSPPPLSVRDARRGASALRERLAALTPPADGPPEGRRRPRGDGDGTSAPQERLTDRTPPAPAADQPPTGPAQADPAPEGRMQGGRRTRDGGDSTPALPERPTDHTPPAPAADQPPTSPAQADPAPEGRMQGGRHTRDGGDSTPALPERPTDHTPPAPAADQPPTSPAQTGPRIRGGRRSRDGGDGVSAGAGTRPGARAGTEAASAATPLAALSRLSLRRGPVTALREVDLTVRPGETVALMGRNGAGKSSLLNTLVGVHAPTSGSASVGAERLTPHRTRPAELLRHVGLVPQEPRDLLYADTVAAECEAADADAGTAAEPGACRALVSTLLPGVSDATHPRDLSEGQRLALALAVILTARPPLLLLDEPTRGLDYAAKSRLVGVLRGLAAEGHAIVLATHDVELVAELAHRVVILAQGEVVADGPTAEVVTSSPSFAPQVSKILAPTPWLTVPQVRAALEAEGPR
ncbi:ABC transporter ATP-binding protein [Streptomyces daliensis]|uniref:ATP-binding cassette domain-containing protein n=1 Tax=Streptomyces daliensis TaxID=299421 RepID=A0A8T4IKB4_9ACTN|nr:ATP-binding cassette domain-containing protein [Streptomyces daliensis]